VDRKRLKFVLLGAGVVLSMVFLIWAGLDRPGGFVYYLTVSEFMQQDRRGTDGFRINGKVVDGTIERQTSGEDVSFLMSDGVASLAVRYHGVIPDTFVDGADVVVEGRLADDHTFEAHTLLAKCPSKYEAAEDDQQANQASSSL